MKCYVCNKAAIGTKKYPTLRVVRGVQIYRCNECGLGFVAKNTPRRSTHEIYSFADYDSRRRQFEQRYKRIIKKINELFVDVSNKNQVKILEVGAGFGLLSRMLDSAGYSVTALEPLVTPRYLEGTNVELVRSRFEAFVKKTNRYDCIILFDVLEHVEDLNESLRGIRKLLRKDGVVIIQTPNYASLMQNMSKDWSWWMIEDHRYFFTKKSLIQILECAKFTLVSYTSYEDWADFRKNLDGWTEGISHRYLSKLIKLFLYGVGFTLRLLTRPIHSFGIGGLHLVFMRKS